MNLKTPRHSRLGVFSWAPVYTECGRRAHFTDYLQPMKFILAALLSAGTVAASYTALVELYRTAHAHLLIIESNRDKATEQAARLQWQLDDMPGNPTVEQLVEHGYIAPSYLNRERVGEPIELPETLPAEPQ